MRSICSKRIASADGTAHHAARCEGPLERYIAVFSYYERPGVMFNRDEQIGFYGRTV